MPTAEIGFNCMKGVSVAFRGTVQNDNETSVPSIARGSGKYTQWNHNQIAPKIAKKKINWVNRRIKRKTKFQSDINRWLAGTERNFRKSKLAKM